MAVDVFRYQSENILVYREFLRSLNKDVRSVQSVSEIPFLPVEFFKSEKISPVNAVPQVIFTSSGTTGSDSSRHYVLDNALYENAFSEIFRQFYGDVTGYTILALLPSYLERKGSSLIYMFEKLIADSGTADSGFYLHDHQKLYNVLMQMQQQGRKTILLGVTFALLDFTEEFKINFPELIVMETGGM